MNKLLIPDDDEFKKLKEEIRLQLIEEMTTKVTNIEGQQEKLINSHEILTVEVKSLRNDMTIDYSQQETLRDLANKKVVAILIYESPAYKELGKKAFSAIWKEFQRTFEVNSYRNTCVADYSKARQFIIDWQPSRELELMIRGANSQMKIEDIIKPPIKED